MKGSASAAASRRPTALLPAPMKPTSATAGRRGSASATTASALPAAAAEVLRRGGELTHGGAAEAIERGVRQSE